MHRDIVVFENGVFGKNQAFLGSFLGSSRKRFSFWGNCGGLLDVSRTYWQRRGVQDWGLVIDCTRCTMPVWKDGGELQGYEPCTEEMLREQTGIVLCEMEELDADRKKTAYERFTWIAGILPFLAEDGKRSRMIAALAAQHQVSRQTIRSYLCQYLAYQDPCVLAPEQNRTHRDYWKGGKQDA